MKLRTTHNSIRIRIRKSELSALHKNFSVEESVKFPDGIVFKYALSIDEHLDDVQVVFNENRLVLSIPFALANEWIATDQVEIESHVEVPGGEKLYLLIEKDFPCLDKPGEDKSDKFWELAPDTSETC